MKRKFLLIVHLFILNLFAWSQDSIKGEIIFCAGVSRSYLYTQDFIAYPSSSDKFSSKSKSPSTQLDLGVIYQFGATFFGFKPVIGASYLSLGFIEKGVFMTDSTSKEYSYAYTHNYGSIFIGIQYKILKHKNLKINCLQSFMPMVIGKKELNMKKYVFATRTSFPIDFEFKSNRHFLLIPFFQTGLSKFNTYKIENKGSNYLPFSYGLQLAAYFMK